MAEQSSVLFGALGAILGYLGGGAADSVLFECLLWPERFYNDFRNPSTLVKFSVFLSMGGPIHAAALKALEKMGNHGLYLGSERGNVLGTASSRILQCEFTLQRTGQREKMMTERPGMHSGWVWCEDRTTNHRVVEVGCPSSMTRTLAIAHARHHLTIRSVGSREEQAPSSASAHLRVADETKRYRTLLGISCSELISTIIGVVAILRDGPSGMVDGASTYSLLSGRKLLPSLSASAESHGK